jgi:hypothetical protein
MLLFFSLRLRRESSSKRRGEERKIMLPLLGLGLELQLPSFVR